MSPSCTNVFSLCIVTVVFIHTMEDDQRLNTLVHEGDTLHFYFSIGRQKITEYSTCCLNNFCDLQLADRISLLHSENSSLTNQYEETMDKLQHTRRD